MKSVMHITVDTELVELAKNLNLNMSGEFNSFLRARLKGLNPVIDQKDIEKDLEKAQLEVFTIQKQLDAKKEFAEKEKKRKQEEYRRNLFDEVTKKR